MSHRQLPKSLLREKWAIKNPINNNNNNNNNNHHHQISYLGKPEVRKTQLGWLLLNNRQPQANLLKTKKKNYKVM